MQNHPIGGVQWELAAEQLVDVAHTHANTWLTVTHSEVYPSVSFANTRKKNCEAVKPPR